MSSTLVSPCFGSLDAPPSLPRPHLTVVAPLSASPRRQRQPTHVYVRRRVMVASLLLSLLVALGMGAGSVLADRGGEPASVPTVRPAP